MQVDVQQIKNRVAEQSETVHRLLAELSKTIVGQKEMISRLLVGLLSDGHILLEGVPGLAKTTAIKSLAQSLATEFRRIQFTPDLLPADLIGTMIYVPSEAQFRTRKGPIFANFILADEINRAPSKVQSALLEAMQERQVTIGDHTYPLPGLFLVMATQNPDRAGGHLSAARGPSRPLHAESENHLPAGRRGTQGPGHVAGRHGPVDQAGARAGRRQGHAGRGQADLHRRPGEAIHLEPGSLHARSGGVRDEGP